MQPCPLWGTAACRKTTRFPFGCRFRLQGRAGDFARRTLVISKLERALPQGSAGCGHPALRPPGRPRLSRLAAKFFSCSVGRGALAVRGGEKPVRPAPHLTAGRGYGTINKKQDGGLWRWSAKEKSILPKRAKTGFPRVYLKNPQHCLILLKSSVYCVAQTWNTPSIPAVSRLVFAAF